MVMLVMVVCYMLPHQTINNVPYTSIEYSPIAILIYKHDYLIDTIN